MRSKPPTPTELASMLARIAWAKVPAEERTRIAKERWAKLSPEERRARTAKARAARHWICPRDGCDVIGRHKHREDEEARAALEAAGVKPPPEAVETVAARIQPPAPVEPAPAPVEPVETITAPAEVEPELGGGLNIPEPMAPAPPSVRACKYCGAMRPAEALLVHERTCARLRGR